MATLLEQDETPSIASVPYGFCGCGCGEKCNLATQNSPSRGLVKGEPYKFILNHGKRIHLPLSAAIQVVIDGKSYRKVPLTRGKFSTINESQIYRVMAFKWFAKKNSRSDTWYAARTAIVGGKKVIIMMHQFIFDPTGELQVDHKSTDGLDNRTENLRAWTGGQNQSNVKRKKHNTSGYKGVSWHRRICAWQVYINANGVRYYLGYFPRNQKVAAALAYDAKARELHGEFAQLNFPEERKAA